ncbi:MAG: DUF4352 domain-containing protein [Actinomycetaceae bacterium]|nr:DUF4352 domain-containing protein [Actinomycetaceae bacterium]
MNDQQSPFSEQQNSYDPAQPAQPPYDSEDQSYSPQNQEDLSSGQQYAPLAGQDYPTQQYNQQQSYPPHSGDYPTQQYAPQSYPPQGGYDDTAQQYQGYPPQGGDYSSQSGNYPGQQYGQAYPNQGNFPPSDNYPSAPHDQDNKPPVYKQTWFFIVIALIVALIIGGIVLALTVSSDKKNADGSTPTQTESSKKTDEGTTDPSHGKSTEEPDTDSATSAPNGGEGELGVIDLSIVDTQTSPTKSKDAFSDETVDSKAGEFVWIKVALKNTGDEPITVLASDFKAQVDGKTFKSESDIIKDPDGELAGLVFDINPGTTEEGWILFDLPSGAKDKHLYVEDLFGDSSSAKVKF